MVKSYEKFNKRLGEEYWGKFVKRDIQLYDCIKKILSKYLSGKNNVKGLDIGAGPGIGAWILGQLGISGELYSVEPSDNYKEGEKLAEKLKLSGSKTLYYPKKGEMSDAIALFDLKEESLDYILFLRSVHEIMLSYKDYKDFVKDFKIICSLIKKEGFIVIADPQYSEFIYSAPHKYAKIIQAIRKYKEETLGHSHALGDYLTLKKLKKIMPEDFILSEKVEIENNKDFEFIKSKGFNLKESPTEFYVVCYKRR